MSAFVTAVLVLGLLANADTIENARVLGRTLSDWANLIQVAGHVAPVLALLIFAPVFILSTLAWRLRIMVWPAAGFQALTAAEIQRLQEPLERQRNRIANNTAWPFHRASAKAAGSVRAIDFGDATFGTPAADRRLIGRFLARPTRVPRYRDLQNQLLIVTGEPGAGKSVLGQEIHASLSRGIEEGRHGLIPIVLFASDFSLDALASDSRSGRSRLKDVLVRYFHSPHGGDDRELADFLESTWEKRDFLIIVDGLDEIAQRSAYEDILTMLKDLIFDEMDRFPGLNRRFLMSCRLEDDIAAFADASSVVLRGLQSERARRAFCENLIRRQKLPGRNVEFLKAALNSGSGQLASADVFRRNPYFLTLLLDYFEQRRGSAMPTSINFDLLIQDYIGRETERPFNPIAQTTAPANRAKLRRDVDRTAGFFLQFAAYAMTVTTDEGALYGRAHISPQLIADFCRALGTASDADARDMEMGGWGHMTAFLARLSQNRSLSEVEFSHFVQTEFLDENDIRLFQELAVRLNERPAPVGPDLIMAAFSTLARANILEPFAWYEALAVRLADAAKDADSSESQALIATLLLARGLAAAHLLRLIYVEQDYTGIYFRFRHRRLAEYYAALYFRARWQRLQPLPSSPWLTPVLNLVSAIEGDRCLALGWFVERLPDIGTLPAFQWRDRLVSVTEAAAFAERGSAYTRRLNDLVSRLIHAYFAITTPKADSVDSRPDPVSELAVTNALEFLAELAPGSLKVDPAAAEAFSARQADLSAPTIVNAGNVVAAFETLTRYRRPWWHRLKEFWKALENPNLLAPHGAWAFRRGRGLDWCITVAYLAAAEFGLLVVLPVLAAQALVTLMAEGLDAASRHQLEQMGVAGLMVVVLALRLFFWWRSPSASLAVTAWPARVALVVIRYTVLLAVFLLVSLFSLRPDWSQVGRAVLRTWRALPGFLMRATKAATVVILVLSAGFAVAYGASLLPSRERPVAAETPATSTSGPASPPTPAPTTKTLDRPEPAPAPVVPAPPTCGDLAPRSPPPATMRAVTDAAEVQRFRAGLTARLQHLKVRYLEAQCDHSGQLSFEDRARPVLDAILVANPRLMPIPEPRAKPLVNAEDLATLRALTAAPLPSVRSEDLQDDFRATFQRAALRSRLGKMTDRIEAVLAARRSGRITDQPNGAYPASEQFPAFAMTLDHLIGAAQAQTAALSEADRALGLSAKKALIVISLLIPMMLGLIWLTVMMGLGARDRRHLKALEKAPTSEIYTTLRSVSASDRLRRRLTAFLLERRDIVFDEAAINGLDEVARDIAGRPGVRNAEFAAHLAGVVAQLSKRLARRT